MSPLALFAIALWQAQVPPPVEPPFTPEEFQRLRVLEGHWSGVEQNGDIIFETYDLTDESTLRRRVYFDSAFARPVAESQVRLEGGEITYRSQAQVCYDVRYGACQYRTEDRTWRAVRLTGDAIEFEPVSAPYGMSWRLDNPARIEMVRSRTGDNAEPASFTYTLVPAR